MAREIRYQCLRPGELIAERERCPLVYLPIGPLEWHGPHLPYGTDALNAQEASYRLARKTGGVVLPTLFLGTERERRPEMLRAIGFRGDEYIVGMDFPANPLPSLYYPEEVLAVVVRATLDLLIAQRYRVIAIINGHGAQNQIATLSRLTVEYSNTRPARVLFLMPAPGFVRGEGSWSHATRGETAIMRAVAPESVDTSTLPDGPLRNTALAVVDDPTFRGTPTPDYTVRPEEDPRLATAEEGEASLNTVVAELAPVIRQALAEMGSG